MTQQSTNIQNFIGAGGDPFALTLKDNPYNIIPSVTPDNRMPHILRTMQTAQKQGLSKEEKQAFRVLRNISSRLAWDFITLGTTQLISHQKWLQIRQFLKENRHCEADYVCNEEWFDLFTNPAVLHIRAILCLNEVCQEAASQGFASDGKLKKFIGFWASLLSRQEWLTQFARYRCQVWSLGKTPQQSEDKEFVEKVKNIIVQVLEWGIGDNSQRRADWLKLWQQEKTAIEVMLKACGRSRKSSQFPLNLRHFGSLGLAELGKDVTFREQLKEKASNVQPSALPLTSLKTGRVDLFSSKPETAIVAIQWVFSELGLIATEVWNGNPQAAQAQLQLLSNVDSQKSDWFASQRSFASSLELLKVEVLLLQFQEQIIQTELSEEEISETVGTLLYYANSLKQPKVVVEQVENLLCGRLKACTDSKLSSRSAVEQLVKTALEIRSLLLGRDAGEKCSQELAKLLNKRGVIAWNRCRKSNRQLTSEIQKQIKSDYLKAAELAPHNSQIISNLSYFVIATYHRIKDKEEQTELLKDTLNRVDSCLNLGSSSKELKEDSKVLWSILHPEDIDEILQKKAQQLLSEGDQLYEQGTTESLNQAITKYEQALPTWQALEKPKEKAVTLNKLGNVYSKLRKPQQALDYFYQSLDIYCELEDRAGETKTDRNIDKIFQQIEIEIKHTTIPEKRKRAIAQKLFLEGKQLYKQRKLNQAISKWQEALSFWQELRAYKEKAETLYNLGNVYWDIEETQQTLDYFYKALPIFRDEEDFLGKAKTLHSLGNVHRKLEKTQQALDFFYQACAIYNVLIKDAEKSELNNHNKTILKITHNIKTLLEKEKTGETIDYKKLIKAKTLLLEGEKLYKKETAKALKQAISKWQEALPLFHALEERKTQVMTLHHLGFVHRELGKPQQALNYLNDALSICRNVKDRLGEAETLKILGDVYRDMGDVQKALDYLNDALSICRVEGNQKKEAETLNNLAGVHMDRSNVQRAIADYNHARSIFQNLNDLVGEAATLNNLGNVYRELGRLEKAMEDLNQALSICRKENYRGGEAQTLNNLAAVYQNMGEAQKALILIWQIYIVKLIIESKSYSLMRYFSSKVGYSLALDYLNQALTIRRDIGDPAGQAETLHNLGFIYRNMGKLRQALEHLNQALTIRRDIGDRAGQASTHDNLALVYDEWGEPQQALKHLNEALPICHDIGDRAGEANILSNIAGIQYRAKNLQEALSNIARAIGLLEQIRHNIVSPELKTSYFSTIEGHYKFKTTILMQLHQQNPTEGNDIKAFETCENSKARGLLDLLTEAKLDLSDGVLPELMQKKHSLEQERESLEQRRVEIENNKEPNTEQQTAEINKRIKEILTSLEFIKSEILIIKNPHPDIKSKPLTLQQIQQEILDEDTVLLQYSLGDEESYLWVVTTESFNSVELLSVKSINELALEFYHFLSEEKPDIYSRGMLGTVKTTDKDDSSSNIPDHDSRTINAQKIAQRLSQILLGEIAPQLNKKQRIVVVGDGSLHYIPFAALPNPSNLDINNLTPLIKDYEVINLPSSSTLATLRKHCQECARSKKKIAVLADPIFDIDDNRVKTKQTNNNQESTSDVNRTLLQRAARNVNRDSWKRLDGTREEAQAILKLIPESEEISAISAFGFAANRNWLTSPQLKECSIIHLATHGCADSINPELSGLILSLVDEQGKHQNGYFRVHDVFNLKLSAELVVLSACQTGLGENVRGEGIVGLTRGFMYAGTPRVLVSLWNVSDSATAWMMEQFYRLMLEEGLTPAEALRAAQIEMQTKTEWKSPYYWAAFTLQGEWK